MSYLNECGPTEAQKVLQHCNDLRQTYRHHRKGFSNDRGRVFRHILSFHPSVMFHPEYSKYFDKDMDPHERRKNLYAFARKFPQYVVVDKL